MDEFLDSEWYVPWDAPPPHPHERDPWRDRTWPNLFLLPRGMIEVLAQHDRMVEIERYDQLRIQDVAESIERTGLQEPLRILVDYKGAISLKDGHHRVVATRRWAHFSYLPVRLEVVEALKVNRPPRLAPMLSQLLAEARPA